MIPRRHADFWWEIARARDRQPYGYGGPWDARDVTVSTDCSGLVSNCLEALVRGPDGFDFDREPYSTESWRALDYGQVGPFGSICVQTPADIPADAAVGIGLHHGGGGPNSHMGCTVFDPDVGQINCESSGDYGQRIGGPARGLYLPDGHTVWAYWNDYAYLPGPIESANWKAVSDALTGEENLMATADDVTRELTSGSEVVLYEGADWPNGELRTGRMRVWLERLAWDLLRVQDGVDHNRNSDGKSKKLGLRDSVRRIVFELTLWTPMLSLAELVTKRTSRETTHGHALKAASYGDATIRILGRIADKLDVDIDDLLD